MRSPSEALQLEDIEPNTLLTTSSLVASIWGIGSSGCSLRRRESSPLLVVLLSDEEEKRIPARHLAARACSLVSRAAYATAAAFCFARRSDFSMPIRSAFTFL